MSTSLPQEPVDPNPRGRRPSPVETLTYVPDQDHRAEIVDLDEHLRQAADTGSEYAHLVTDVGEVNVPPQMLALLFAAVHNLRRGIAVDLVPRQPVLTTQEAADMLGISRPTLIRLLEGGVIPFERPGKQRRIKLADLIEYRRRQKARSTLLDEMVEMDQRAGMYDTDPGAWRDLLEQARREVAEEYRRRGALE